MCVIILQPKGTELTKARAERLWKVNPDGGGFAFINEQTRKIETWKAMDFTPFWSRYLTERRGNPNADFLLHMRIATHGTVDIDNVHPIVINDDNVVAHNGVIHRAPLDVTKKKSDTVMFVEEILPQLPEQWLDSELFFQMVEEWVDWSKLVFLTTDPELSFRYYILNESKGQWTDGMWFSSFNGINKPTKWQQESDKKQKERLAAANAAAKKYREDAGLGTNSQVIDIAGRKPTPGGKPMTFSDAFDDEGWPEGVSEATARAEWEEWKAELNLDLKGYADLAIPLGTGAADLREFLGENEAEVFLQLLIRDRDQQGLHKEISWSLADGEIDCFGCDEEVDLETGQCSCWDKFCTDCEKIAGLCDCKDGYSSNLKLWSEMGPKGNGNNDT